MEISAYVYLQHDGGDDDEGIRGFKGSIFRLFI